MSVEATRSRLGDHLYQSALGHLQKGDWKAGLAELAGLAERYPLDDSLSALRQEMELRARVDQDEREDRRRERRRRVVKLASRLMAVLLVGLLVYGGVRSYSVWFQQRVDEARQNLERQIRVVELSTKFANAQALLRAGRTAEAQALLQEIATVKPDFPGLPISLERANAAASLEVQYAEALRLIERQDWYAALVALQAIAAQEPNYKDVALQISHIEKQYLLQETLAQADEQFEAEAWEEAASEYESLRALEPLYQAETVEERLYTSYVNAARASLVGQSDSLAALGIAEGYFRKALALRPQDPEIKTERELAGLYLKAQADFNQARWSEVITALEIIYGKDPQYARGTARQTLYEAYVARGDALQAQGDYESVLRDYQLALVVAQADRQATLRLFEAYLKVAEAQNALANYEAAALLYRSVVEVGGLRQRALENSDLAAVLQEADGHCAAGNFSGALEAYRRALSTSDEAQPQDSIIHVVQSGEYLILIAGRYGSTVQAIVEANDIPNRSLIYPGQELVIPVLP